MSLDKFKLWGEFTPVFYCCNSEDNDISKYRIYYPEEMRNSNEKFPVIIAVNGINEPAYHYCHVFEHLASWGFIVVGNYDIDSWRGYSAHANLELLLQLNQKEGNVFYKKVDTDNIGILGHSEGGVGAINAATKYKNSNRFKTIYTASIPSQFIARFMSWNYDVSKLTIPYCMVQGTKPLDSRLISPHHSAKKNYHKVSDNVFKMKARCYNGTHNDTLRTMWDCYTAWFLWHLQGSEEAKQIFYGENAAILFDSNWIDVQKNF